MQKNPINCQFVLVHKADNVLINTSVDPDNGFVEVNGNFGRKIHNCVYGNRGRRRTSVY